MQITVTDEMRAAVKEVKESAGLKLPPEIGGLPVSLGHKAHLANLVIAAIEAEERTDQTAAPEST